MKFMRMFLFVFICFINFNIFCLIVDNDTLAPKATQDSKKFAYKLKVIIENFFILNKNKFQNAEFKKDEKIVFTKPKIKDSTKVPLLLWIVYGNRTRIATSGSITSIGEIGGTPNLVFEQETIIPLSQNNINRVSLTENDFILKKIKREFNPSLSYEIVNNFLKSPEFINITHQFLNQAGININIPAKKFIFIFRQILEEALLILKSEMKSSNRNLNAYIKNQNLLEKEMSYFLIFKYLNCLESFVLDEAYLDNQFAFSA